MKRGEGAKTKTHTNVNYVCLCIYHSNISSQCSADNDQLPLSRRGTAKEAERETDSHPEHPETMPETHAAQQPKQRKKSAAPWAAQGVNENERREQPESTSGLEVPCPIHGPIVGLLGCSVFCVLRV